MFLYARVSIVFIDIYIGETIMKKLLSIAMLSLALTACGAKIIPQHLATLNGARITYECSSYTYHDFRSVVFHKFDKRDPVSLKIKELCKNKEK